MFSSTAKMIMFDSKVEKSVKMSYVEIGFCTKIHVHKIRKRDRQKYLFKWGLVSEDYLCVLENCP